MEHRKPQLANFARLAFYLGQAKCLGGGGGCFEPPSSPRAQGGPNGSVIVGVVILFCAPRDLQHESVCVAEAARFVGVLGQRVLGGGVLPLGSVTHLHFFFAFGLFYSFE